MTARTGSLEHPLLAGKSGAPASPRAWQCKKRREVTPSLSPSLPTRSFLPAAAEQRAGLNGGFRRGADFASPRNAAVSRGFLELGHAPAALSPQGLNQR